LNALILEFDYQMNTLVALSINLIYEKKVELKTEVIGNQKYIIRQIYK